VNQNRLKQEDSESVSRTEDADTEEDRRSLLLRDSILAMFPFAEPSAPRLALELADACANHSGSSSKHDSPPAAAASSEDEVGLRERRELRRHRLARVTCIWAGAQLPLEALLLLPAVYASAAAVTALCAIAACSLILLLLLLLPSLRGSSSALLFAATCALAVAVALEPVPLSWLLRQALAESHARLEPLYGLLEAPSHVWTPQARPFAVLFAAYECLLEASRLGLLLLLSRYAHSVTACEEELRHEVAVPEHKGKQRAEQERDDDESSDAPHTPLLRSVTAARDRPLVEN
jgi:hypothetical protein